MISLMFLILIVICSVILHFEDKNRRSGEIDGPVWTPLIFKIWTAGSGLFLAIFFIWEDGEWLVDLIKGWGTPDLNARIVAAVATVWLLMIYGVVTYLGIIQDDDEDLNIVADAVYYDGE